MEAAPPPNTSDVQLTPHFKLSEFTVSDTARRLGLSNMPPPDKLANVRVAADGMERVREILGGTPINISSGYRSPEVNQAVGGSRTSDHMEGFSVDFRSDRFGTPYQIVEKLITVPDLMDRVDQIIFEKARWVHISFAPEHRKQVLTAYDEGGRTIYAAGLKPLDGNGRPLNA